MGNDNWILYVAVGAGAFYLISKLGKPVQDTGSAIATTTQNASNALAPWLKDIEMVGRLPELFANALKKKRELTVAEAEAMTMSTPKVLEIAKQNYASNMDLFVAGNKKFQEDKVLEKFAKTNPPVLNFRPSTTSSKSVAPATPKLPAPSVRQTSLNKINSLIKSGAPASYVQTVSKILASKGQL